jgi:nucleoprotein TPR
MLSLSVIYQYLRITELMIAVQTNLRAERDKLLAEKESWNKPSGSAPTAAESGPAPSEWEAEKAQLLKARDEALERVKV